MLIEFRCGNYSDFDAATGEHKICGQRMSASAEEAGLVVACPKCQQDCTVPAPKSAAESKTPLATPRRPASQRCPKCGGRLNKRGSCTACSWKKPQFFKSEQSLDEMEMQPAGMMLWFAEIISEGVPPKVFSLISIAVIGFLLCAWLAFALFVVGGFVGGFLFLIGFAGLLLFGGMTYKGFQFLRDGNAELAWFQKPFWNAILMVSRSRQWEGNDAKSKNRNVLTLRGEHIDDQAVLQHTELKTAQVLDLEGASIGDKTIQYLYRLKDLQCLVVRETKTSHLAVTRLQQSFPKLWIWH